MNDLELTLKNLKILKKFLNKPLPNSICFDMSSFREHPDVLILVNHISQILKPECGTSACLLGLCVLVPELKPSLDRYTAYNRLCWNDYSSDIFPVLKK